MQDSWCREGVRPREGSATGAVPLIHARHSGTGDLGDRGCGLQSRTWAEALPNSMQGTRVLRVGGEDMVRKRRGRRTRWPPSRPATTRSARSNGQGVQRDKRRTVACLWESHGSSRNLGLTFLLFSFQTPSLHLAVLLLIDQEAFSSHYRKILLLDL